MIYVGIDVGLKGAIVALDEDKLAFQAMCPIIRTKFGKKHRTEYDLSGMDRVLASIIAPGETVCAVERAHAMPKQGVTSMFSFGVGYGLWQGLLAGRRIPFEIVAAKTWQATMLKGHRGSGECTKRAAFHAAIRLFPDLEVRLKEHWGLCDAALIAEYLRRSRIGETQ